MLLSCSIATVVIESPSSSTILYITHIRIAFKHHTNNHQFISFNFNFNFTSTYLNRYKDVNYTTSGTGSPSGNSGNRPKSHSFAYGSEMALMEHPAGKYL